MIGGLCCLLAENVTFNDYQKLRPRYVNLTISCMSTTSFNRGFMFQGGGGGGGGGACQVNTHPIWANILTFWYDNLA